MLGADKGIALTSVQTPLTSFFRFQGWTSKFSTTPPGGLRNLSRTVAGSWKVTGYGLAEAYHRFASDRSLHACDAHRALSDEGLRIDTTKVFLTLDWAV